jgi:hypothetical protein
MSKFIRAFIYGINEGETVTVTINGVFVDFTAETAQQDVSIVVAPEAEEIGDIIQPQ